jgi:hypothetical protein
VSKTYTVPDEHVPTVENALDADDELPTVDRSRGRTPEGAISTGDALAEVAEAFTGWSE